MSESARSDEDRATDFVRPLWHHGVIPTHDGLPIELVKAEGIYLWDSNGKRYIDGFGSRGAAILGHGRSELADAASEQMRRGAYLALVFGCTNQPARQLAERLLAKIGQRDGAVWFSSSGSEAIEAAIKIALNYHLNRGEPQRRIILTCRSSYHGITLGAAAATGLADHDHFTREAASSFVRLPQTPHDSDVLTAEFLTELDATIERIGAEKIAALVAEPIPTPGGVRVPVDYHWLHVKNLLARHGILLIADEVLDGFGRTGTMFAQEHFGYRADLTTLAKGLTSGYIPLSACVAAPHIASEFDGFGPRALRHLGTYSGHPAACAVALRALDLIEDEGVVDNAAAQGTRLRKELERICADNPQLLGSPTGKGLLYSIDVHSNELKRKRCGTALQIECRSRGLFLTAAEDVIYFSPPLVVNEEQVDEMMNVFENSVSAILADEH